MPMRIEKLPKHARWQPQEWEVFAPQGFKFIGGEHSRVTHSRKAAETIAKREQDLMPCHCEDCQP